MAPEGAIATQGLLNSADGTKLAFRAWPEPAAMLTFAVVHGLGEHSGRYERFARGMARYQMATYALDLRGHGNSAGQRGHVDSWSQWSTTPQLSSPTSRARRTMRSFLSDIRSEAPSC